MAWKYSQKTGALTNPAGNRVGIGYSGHGDGLDNPALEQQQCEGPIPQGEWEIGQFFDDPGHKGPLVAHLMPLPGTETFGRSGFMIHGDNEHLNHSASEGCIVLPRILREMILASNDRTLVVTG